MRLRHSGHSAEEAISQTEFSDHGINLNISPILYIARLQTAASAYYRYLSVGLCTCSVDSQILVHIGVGLWIV